MSWGNTFPFSFHLFLRTFQQPNPFCCNRSTTNLFMISFLSRTIDFFFFFLSLGIYLWLAETSQQPISQTTWLKVTPHCNHCNHCNIYDFISRWWFTPTLKGTQLEHMANWPKCKMRLALFIFLYKKRKEKNADSVHPTGGLGSQGCFVSISL